MQHTHSCTACFLQPNSLSTAHIQTLISPSVSVASTQLSALPFIPSLHPFPANSTRLALSFLLFSFWRTMLFVFRGQRRERRCLAASLPRSPMSPACHSLCVCNDVRRALSATGLCLFWAAPGSIMTHYWGTRGSRATTWKLLSPC